nr:MAG TPA: hypothetical protein [Caudoviricetes sp.]
MALYLQNISKSSKNYPGELTPGISFLITDNINEPVHLQLLKFARIMVWM